MIDLNIIITDLTFMHGGYFCLAGIVKDGLLKGKYVRPLIYFSDLNTDGKGHLYYDDIIKYGLYPYTTVNFKGKFEYDKNIFDLNEFSEDFQVDKFEVIGKENDYNFLLKILSDNSLSVEEFYQKFSTYLQIDANKSFYKHGLGCNVYNEGVSLFTIDLNNIDFFYFYYKVRNNKLDFRLKFGIYNIKFDLPITDAVFYTYSKNKIINYMKNRGELKWINYYFKKSKNKYLRLGLTRCFKNFYRIQINGIYRDYRYKIGNELDKGKYLLYK